MLLQDNPILIEDLPSPIVIEDWDGLLETGSEDDPIQLLRYVQDIFLTTLSTTHLISLVFFC